MRVLIVEDERISRKAMHYLLNAHGHHALAVGSAEQADELLRKDDSFDVVLLDVDLPGESGISLLRRMTRRRHRTKAVLVTAVDRGELRDAAPPDVSYVQKPVDFRQLLGVIGQLSHPG